MSNIDDAYRQMQRSLVKNVNAEKKGQSTDHEKIAIQRALQVGELEKEKSELMNRIQHMQNDTPRKIIEVMDEFISHMYDDNEIDQVVNFGNAFFRELKK